jgi:nucleoside-diphosphate-sugar epimerase
LSLNKVVVATGHTGTIGKHLKNSILKPNWNLLIPNTVKFNFTKNKNFDFIHLAGIVGESNVNENIALSRKINVEAARDLGKKFLETSTGRFIYISSSHVYGNTNVTMAEEQECNPVSKYAEQKLQAEKELIAIFKNDASRLLILRVFSILDWGMPPGTLGNTIEKIIDGGTQVVQNAEDIRDFLTPKTVASVITSISENYNCHGIINICSGMGISVRQATEKFFNLSGKIASPSIFIKGHSIAPTIVGCNMKLLALNDSEFKLSWELFNRPSYSRNEN